MKERIQTMSKVSYFCKKKKLMLKIGVLGASGLAKIHIRLLIELNDQFELVGFYEPDDLKAQQISDVYAVKRFLSYDDLLEKVDCVDIVSSTLKHYELATLALRKSKHIFLDKPITQTIEEARSFINLSREASVKFQVGSTNRFNPAYLASISSINKPKLIDAQNHLQYNAESSEISLVLDLMMSDIDIILTIVKSGIRKISATGISVFSKENDIVNVKLEFDNGCVANLSASRLSKFYRNEMQFFQKEKCLAVNFLTNELEEVDLKNSGDSKLIVSTLPEIEALNPIKYELKSFYDVIVNDKDPIVSLDDGYKSLIVAHKILDILNHSNVPAVDNNY